MSQIKKKGALIVLVLMMTITPVFANMPVIDVSSIAQAVTSYVQQIREWNAQIQQWKSEFDRIAKAAKQLSSGDFSAIVGAVGSLAGQASSWNLGQGMLGKEDNFIDDLLEYTSNTSYSILDVMSSSQMFIKNATRISTAIEKNLEKTLFPYKESENPLQGTAGTASGTLGIASNILDLVTSALVSGGDIAEEFYKAFKGMGYLLKISPKEVGEIIKEETNSEIQAATKNQASDKDDLAALIDKLKKDKSDLQEQLSKVSAEEASKQAQLQAKIAQMEALMNSYEEMYKKAQEYYAAAEKLSTQIQEQYEAEETKKEMIKQAEESAAKEDEARRQLEQLNPVLNPTELVNTFVPNPKDIGSSNLNFNFN